MGGKGTKITSVGNVLVFKQTKSNRKEEKATVYYSKKSCIVILN